MTSAAVALDHEKAKATRDSLVTLGQAALRELAVELRGCRDKDAVPLAWFRKYKIVADQLRRDFPDRMLQPPELPAAPPVQEAEADDPLAGMILTFPKAG